MYVISVPLLRFLNFHKLLDLLSLHSCTSLPASSFPALTVLFLPFILVLFLIPFLPVSSYSFPSCYFLFLSILFLRIPFLPVSSFFAVKILPDPPLPVSSSSCPPAAFFLQLYLFFFPYHMCLPYPAFLFPPFPFCQVSSWFSPSCFFLFLPSCCFLSSALTVFLSLPYVPSLSCDSVSSFSFLAYFFLISSKLLPDISR
jgi:hypothetical protein